MSVDEFDIVTEQSLKKQHSLKKDAVFNLPRMRMVCAVVAPILVAVGRSKWFAVSVFGIG